MNRPSGLGALIAFLPLMFVLGCLLGPGGGGSSQIAPDAILTGESAPIRVDLNTWGSGGKIDHRYTNLSLDYHLVGDSAFQSVLPTRIAQDRNRESYLFLIPPYPGGATGQIEYFINLKLDGQPSRIPGYKNIVLRSQSQPQNNAPG